MSDLSHINCDAAVSAFLAQRKGCQRDITKATGYAKTSVSKSVVKLRAANSPLLANLLDGRLSLEEKRKPAPIVPRFIVASAIDGRTPLERAWA